MYIFALTTTTSSSLQPFSAATKAFYNSAFFMQKQNESAAFLSQLSPYLDGRPVTLQNMVPIIITPNSLSSAHHSLMNSGTYVWKIIRFSLRSYFWY
jgi:hypothetical protein